MSRKQSFTVDSSACFLVWFWDADFIMAIIFLSDVLFCSLESDRKGHWAYLLAVCVSHFWELTHLPEFFPSSLVMMAERKANENHWVLHASQLAVRSENSMRWWCYECGTLSLKVCSKGAHYLLIGVYWGFIAITIWHHILGFFFFLQENTEYIFLSGDPPFSIHPN